MAQLKGFLISQQVFFVWPAKKLRIHFMSCMPGERVQFNTVHFHQTHCLFSLKKGLIAGLRLYVLNYILRISVSNTLKMVLSITVNIVQKSTGSINTLYY